jgi:type II secretory pathway pseudopilin PulG
MKTYPRFSSRGRAGFTLIELLLGSTLLLIMIIGTLALYDRSNKASVDQTQFSEVQHDVRSAMYFMSRDSRMAGVGLVSDVSGYAVEGQDAFGPAPEAADSLRLMGNFDDPLDLRIRDYNGSSATAFLYDYALENEPYDCPGYYENKTVFIMSTRCPGCYAFRFIAPNSMHGCGTGTAHVDFQPGQAPGVNPPGGLSDTLCDDTCWIDAIITMAQIKLYWLDQTGDPTDYPSLNLTVGQDGYLGIPNVLYMSTNTDVGVAQHMPLAMNIENIQFEYNGDFDHDGSLDGFRPWDNANWTIQTSDDEATRDTKRQLLARISQVRILVLGRTPRPYLTVSKTPVSDVQLYRRPTLSNSAGATADDWRRRFLLESTATIRNNALIIYNEGQR